MTAYTLLQSNGPTPLSIVFSNPQYSWPSGKMTVAMALPDARATLVGYDSSMSTVPTSDGLDVTGNSVSTLDLKLHGSWPGDASITAKWTDENGKPQSRNLSTTTLSIHIPHGSTSPFAISIELNFDGKISGDPKIKVIPPT